MTPQDIIKLTNKQRKAAGLPPLTANQALSLAAQNRVNDMITTKAFSHKVATTTPGIDNWSFIKKAGYAYKSAGENLARGQRTANDVVRQWAKSPSHRKNLLDPRYRDIGVAVARGRDGKRYIVQFFGMQ